MAAADAQGELTAAQELAARLINQAITPYERLASQLDDLTQGYGRNEIGATTFARATDGIAARLRRLAGSIDGVDPAPIAAVFSDLVAQFVRGEITAGKMTEAVQELFNALQQAGDAAGSIDGSLGDNLSDEIGKGIRRALRGLRSEGQSIGRAIGDAITDVVGEKLGDVVADKLEEAISSRVGDTIGEVAGQIGGVVAEIAVRKLAEGISDLFDGDGESRSNIGTLVAPFDQTIQSRRPQDQNRTGRSLTTESGLELTPYFRRDDPAEARRFTVGLRELDERLTLIARVGGFQPDFRGAHLGGPEDGGVANFFGLGSEGSTLSLEEAAAQFARRWVDELTQRGQIPERLARAVAGDTAEAIARSLQALVNVDRLLNLDVVNDLDDALFDLGQSQEGLLQLYGRETEALLELTRAGAETVAEQEALAEQLLTQKSAAAALAAEYRSVGEAVTALLSNTAQGFRDAASTPQAIYDRLITDAETALERIRTTTDPQEIQQLSQDATAALRQAFGLLTEEQQREFGDAFAAFTDQFTEAAKGAVDAGLGFLGESEEEVQARVYGIIEAAAMVQREAAQTFFAAATTIANIPWLQIGQLNLDAANTQVEAADAQKEASGDGQEAAENIEDGTAALRDFFRGLAIAGGINA